LIRLDLDPKFVGLTSPYQRTELILNGTASNFEPQQLDVSRLRRLKKQGGLTAFYLPQFHRSVINDQNWGAGFTEWTNVTKAQPLFFGHVQPRLPRDLGFYDLSISENVQEQISIAQRGGISAFCFYYYRFGSETLLDLPLKKFVAIEQSDVDFCLCWANESWTRSWDGGSKEVLIEQSHSFETDKGFIHEIIPYLSKPNYQVINGKKVILLYRVQFFGESLSRTLDYWREVARKEGVGELAIFATSAFLPSTQVEVDQLLTHVDGLVQFPPHRAFHVQVKLSAELMFTDSFAGKFHIYDQTVEHLRSLYYGSKVVIPTVFPSWDNTPRRREQASIFLNCSPQKFEQEVLNALALSASKPENDGLVFINAWNEWAEGAILEPCRWFGYAYLNSCARAVNRLLARTGDAAVG